MQYMYSFFIISGVVSYSLLFIKSWRILVPEQVHVSFRLPREQIMFISARLTASLFAPYKYSPDGGLPSGAGHMSHLGRVSFSSTRSGYRLLHGL